MDPMSVVQDHQAMRKRRIGCLLRLLTIWFSIMLVIVIAMVFFRSRVERDSAVLEQEVGALIDYKLPAGFYAYSRTGLFGVKLWAFWNENHRGQDDRVTSVFQVFRLANWEDRTLEDVEQEVLAKVDGLLEQNEFHVRAKTVETLASPQGPVRIYRYSGVQRMDYGVFEATACYRFVQTSKGPVQLHTMGLDRTFPPKEHFSFLAGIQPK